MCPSILEEVELDANGQPAPHMTLMRLKTGSGGCDQYIEAAEQYHLWINIGSRCCNVSQRLILGREKFEASNYKQPLIQSMG